MPVHSRVSSRSSRLPSALLATAAASALLFGAASPAQAADGASVAIAFDTPGAISATTLPGWTLPAGNGSHSEAEVVAGALRLSNAQISSFARGLKTPALAVAAGEAEAVNTFDATFTVASSTGAVQNGLGADIALDDGSFTRNGGVLSLLHQDGVLKIGTFAISESVPTTNPSSRDYVWDEHVIASVDPAAAHTVRIVATFIDGTNNDVVDYYVDGALVFTGPSWERLSEVKRLAPPYFPVDRLAITTGGTTASTTGIPLFGNVPSVPALKGAGFLFSGISYSSYDVAPAPIGPTPVPPVDEVPPLAPAPSATPDAPIELPADAGAGQTIGIRAAGFAPFENVHFTWYSEPLFAGWAQADAFGVVTAVFVVPAGLETGMAHTLQAVGEYSGFVANAQISIAAAGTAAESAAQLAATGGTAPGAFALVGVLLLAVGAAAAVVRRRRTA